MEARRLATNLAAYEAVAGPLPGIAHDEARTAFIEQLVESGRRNRYVAALCARELGPRTSDPATEVFDPLRAAISHLREGERDEAFWLLFLFVHFGKHRRAGWKYAREVYGRLGQGGRWDWAHVRSDIPGFRNWLEDNSATMRAPGTPHGFGNHRKYESLDGWKANGTGAVVASYVHWVGASGHHDERFEGAMLAAAGDGCKAFDLLYRSLTVVERFGRTARFDYLSMAGKIGLAAVRPGKAYIVNSTGPRAGACLLLGESEHVGSAVLEEKLAHLEQYIGVGFDALEDALCNWQKSPSSFKPFRG